MRNILFVLDPLETLNVKKDTSLALMWAVERRAWRVFTCELNGLFWANGTAEVLAQRTTLPEDWLAKALGNNAWYFQEPQQRFAMTHFDIIMMRKDPPFNMDYINATYLLEEAEKVGVLVCNKPRSLRDCNEKFFTTTFADLIPPQVIASSKEVLVEFHTQYKDVIYKPLDGMGGKGIFRVSKDDLNLHAILETLTHNYQTQIVAQQFIPEISEGDKRILLINGRVVPYTLARIPQQGENRGNLAAGGVGVGRKLTERDLEIASKLSPELVKRGLLFAGIDVIGDFLTEINVTCPTCVRELDEQFNLDIGTLLMEELETILKRN